MPSAHRHLRPVSLAVTLACAIGLVAGCANQAAPTPQTVTVTASAAAGSAGTGEGPAGSPASSPTTGAGAPITVVAPGSVGGTTSAPGAPGTASSPAAADAGHAPSSGPSLAATTTTTSLTATGPDAAAAAHDLSIGCPVLLSRGDLGKALGRALADQELRVVDVANPASSMTARTKCYYGTDNIAAARPVVLALASYVDSDAADQQLHVTVDAERSAGAKGSALDANGHPTSILIRDGGLAIARIGSVTVSIAIAKGLVADSALPGALIVLMRSVIARLT